MKTVFLRVLEANDKAAAIREAIRGPESARGNHRFEVDAASFASVPRSPFAYWVSERLRRLFKDLPRFEVEGRTAKQGLATADDFRFVRSWWAVPPRRIGERWYPFAKGGDFSPFYADVPALVNWERDGAEIKNYIIQRYPYLNGNAGFVAKNTDFYFRPGLTWPLRGIRFSAQAVPTGCVFSVAGKMAFAEHRDLLWLSAVFNSQPFDQFIAFFAGKVGGVQYEAGLIQDLPIATPDGDTKAALAMLSRRAWSLKRGLDARAEISHAFTLPALLQVEGASLDARARAWAEHARSVREELADIQAEVNERCFLLYGIGEADRRAMTAGFSAAPESGEFDEPSTEAEGNADERGDADAGGRAAALAAELAAWAAGVAFGRFDLRLAIGAPALPAEPDPFDPLPVRSPGMLAGEDDLPLANAPNGYPIVFPVDGVLVNDVGAPRDLTSAVRGVFEAVFGACADEMWQEAAVLLNPKGRDLGAWLASGFFEHHLNRHSKSRRKAPILWQLGTRSAHYSLWLYAHRLGRDSFFQLQNDVVAPKLADEERRLTSLVQSAGGSPSPEVRNAIAVQEVFCEDLRVLLNEVKMIAPLWNPDLDDGVVLTMAPLWRMVSQHKPWQKELKGRWDELVEGKHDWSHLAMHLWPERVVPKCVTDRSLAIAHGLEEVFWAECEDGKWQPRTVPASHVEDLVGERTSPAVQTALQSLLEAPAAVSGIRRRRGAA